MKSKDNLLNLPAYQGWEKPNFFWPMHWVFGFNGKNLIFANKFMVFIPCAVMCIPAGSYHQGWKNPNLISTDALGFWI